MRLDRGKLTRDLTLCRKQIETALQIEPELRACAEIAAKTEGRVGRDRDFLAGDAFDPRARDANRLGKRMGDNPKGSRTPRGELLPDASAAIWQAWP